MSAKHRSSWRKKRERMVYIGLIAAALLLSAVIRIANQFSVDVRFIFLSLVIILLIGVVILTAKKFN